MDGERPSLLFGLSYENLARLCAGEPIVIETSLPNSEGGLGLEGGPTVILCAGETEQSLLADLQAVPGFIVDELHTRLENGELLR